MSTNTSSVVTGAAIASSFAPRIVFEKHVKPFLTPYYFTIAGILGAVTVAFTVLIVLIVLVATNFNVLGWME